jgi:hypothetical protein
MLANMRQLGVIWRSLPASRVISHMERSLLQHV